MRGLSADRALDAYMVIGGFPRLSSRWRAADSLGSFLRRELADRPRRRWSRANECSRGCARASSSSPGPAGLAVARIEEGWETARGRAVDVLVRAAIERLLPDDRFGGARSVAASGRRRSTSSAAASPPGR